MPTPRLNATDAATCRGFLDDLPATLAQQQARDVAPAAAPARAWGDPPIVVLCGAAVPEGFTRFSSCEEAEGVGWYVPEEQVSDQRADAVLTAVGYRPVVQLRVPAEYRPEGPAAALAELGPPVKRHLRLVKRCR